jgi:hypothetical protein
MAVIFKMEVYASCTYGKHRLNEADLLSRIANKKPFFSIQNKRKLRLQYVKIINIGQFGNGKKSSGPMNPHSGSLDTRGVQR